MTHARKQIRAKIITTLTNLTATGSRVFRNRAYKLTDDKLPALRIFFKDEEIEVLCKVPRYIKRTMPVIIEGVAKVTTNIDDKLDEIAEQVETALGADPSLGGLAKKTTNISSTEIDFNNEGDQPIGIIKITFDVVYITIDGAPGTAI